MQKKIQLFTMRVTKEWHQHFKELCNKKARTQTSQVIHSIEIARLVDQILCHGRDDLEFIKKRLTEVATSGNQSFRPRTSNTIAKSIHGKAKKE